MTITRSSVERDTALRMRRLDLQIGEDIHRLRLEAGATLTALSKVVGVHRSHLARIERGQARPSLEVHTAIGITLGADLSIRFFAGSGPRLHDRFQAAMIEAVIGVLDPRWRARVEVPITKPSRGVIDLVLADRSSPVVVAAEAQSELRRLEQQVRWSNEKAEGLRQRLFDEDQETVGVHVSRLLILRSTVSTREVARRFEATLATAYPATTERVMEALTTASAPWPGAGIIWVRVVGDTATVLEHPPRGVSLGRVAAGRKRDHQATYGV